MIVYHLLDKYTHKTRFTTTGMLSLYLISCMEMCILVFICFIGTNAVKFGQLYALYLVTFVIKFNYFFHGIQQNILLPTFTCLDMLISQLIILISAHQTSIRLFERF